MKELYRKYAELIIKVGINLQPGQDVVIRASTNSPKFVNEVTRTAYENGARKVTVEWENEEQSRLNYINMNVEDLKEFPEWQIKKWEYNADKLPCMIFIDDQSPDFLEGIDMKKLAEVQASNFNHIKPFIDKRDGKYQWTIAAIPSLKWAKKVFPHLPEKEAFKELWKVIIKVTRLNHKDPILHWQQHNKNLHDKRDILNEYNFDYLEYTSSNGTSLTIKLQKDHVWLSGSKPTHNGIEYIPNMPTEEIFTMPAKYGVNGIVYSTKPLSYKGNLIEDFYLEFENGKVVNLYAKKGQEVLESIINTDEGSSYLGEVALVPYDSPINNTNVLFYNTLFDENASCHLALGKAYKTTIKNHKEMSLEDFANANYNDSANHVDFMIGSSDLEIIGTTFDNEKILIFKNGNWRI